MKSFEAVQVILLYIRQDWTVRVCVCMCVRQCVCLCVQRRQSIAPSTDEKLVLQLHHLKVTTREGYTKYANKLTDQWVAGRAFKHCESIKQTC